jgi:hypothetical protein
MFLFKVFTIYVHEVIVVQNRIFLTVFDISIDISQYRLLFGFSLLSTDRVPFELLDSAALL